MARSTFATRYGAWSAASGGGCPIEAGIVGRLADNECRHGRLPGDHGPPCGCFAELEGAPIIALPAAPGMQLRLDEAA